MENNIIKLKDFTYFLRVNRNKIVDKWLDSDEVKEIFLKHSIKVSKEDIKIFYDFFDCVTSVMQWELTIAECPTKVKLLKFLNDNQVGSFEFISFFIALKNTISSIFYENQFLSFGLLKNLEEVFLGIANELTKTYEQIQKDEMTYTDSHSNLLNEYKKAVDISSILSKTNTKGIITYVNDKFCEISGFNRSELIGQPHSIVRHPNMPSSIFKELWDTLKSKQAWQGIITNMKKDGRKYVVDSTVIPILDVDGDIIEYIALRHDVTEFEQTKEQLSTLNRSMKNKVDELYSMTVSLEEEASIDSLTGVFNRAKFDKFFDFEIEKAKMSKNILTMVILDIDHFKSINDTYGHHVGDAVLKQLAQLISKDLKRVDIFARWGGEEFAILLPSTTLDGAVALSEKVRKTIEDSNFSMVESITASFGVGIFEENETKSEFFKRVDDALFEAKRTGRNKVKVAN